MHNVHVDSKNFLKLLIPEKQLIEINWVINELNKSNRPGYKISKGTRILKELITLKKKNNSYRSLIIYFSCYNLF